jgi:hypothetical protein
LHSPSARSKSTRLLYSTGSATSPQWADCVEKLGFHGKTSKNFLTERQLEILARGSAKSMVWRCVQLYQAPQRKYGQLFRCNGFWQKNESADFSSFSTQSAQGSHSLQFAPMTAMRKSAF